jgi:hypothetical protein
MLTGAEEVSALAVTRNPSTTEEQQEKAFRRKSKAGVSHSAGFILIVLTGVFMSKIVAPLLGRNNRLVVANVLFPACRRTEQCRDQGVADAGRRL